jgi:hypothetical protein
MHTMYTVLDDDEGSRTSMRPTVNIIQHSQRGVRVNMLCGACLCIKLRPLQETIAFRPSFSWLHMNMSAVRCLCRLLKS